MIITYNGGKMIVTHPTGIVNIYTEADILDQRKHCEVELAESKDEIKYLDNLIKQIKASIPKLPLLKRVAKLFARKEKTNALG